MFEPGIAKHFTQGNPRGPQQGDVPALLRRVAETLDELSYDEILDVVVFNGLADDGEYWPQITVYYTVSDE